MKRRRLALMVMVDALGSRMLREVGFLPELEYRASLRTVLGFSCACQPTLLSGRMPNEHGHGAMYVLADGESALEPARPFSRLPSWIADNHRARTWIHGRVASKVSGYFSLYDVPTRLLPRFDLVEKRSIFEPGGLRGAPTIFDRLVELKLNYRSYDWRTSEEENLLRVEEDVEGGLMDFVFLYLPRLDGYLHSEGPGGDSVMRHLAYYETWIRRLLEKAHETADVVEFFLFSDHGMSPVHGGVDVKGEVERRLGGNGRGYLAFYDSTMARFWVDDPAVNSELASLLGELPYGRVIPEDEKVDLGIRFADRSQGDVMFVVDEGLLVLPSYMGRHMLAGMHGYHPDATHADACLLGTYAPDYNVGHIKDLHSLMEGIAVRLSEEKA